MRYNTTALYNSNMICCYVYNETKNVFFYFFISKLYEYI